MAIDVSAESVVTLTGACKILPPRRQGRRPNVATLYRWTNEGVRGVRLEYVMVGNTRCTSHEALQRFFDRLTEQAEADRPTAPARSALPPSRQRQIEAAERRLADSSVTRRHPRNAEPQR